MLSIRALIEPVHAGSALEIINFNIFFRKADELRQKDLRKNSGPHIHLLSKAQLGTRLKKIGDSAKQLSSSIKEKVADESRNSSFLRRIRKKT